VSVPFPHSTIIGYPRIGPRRELKKALEAYWSGQADGPSLEREARRLREATYARLTDLGLDPHGSAIPASFSLYDQVLDTAVVLGAVPERFADLPGHDGALDLPAYFTLARGDAERPPLELTKWFDTNYHYLVPEIGEQSPFRLSAGTLLRHVEEAADAGYGVRPTLIGPVTFLLLSKAARGARDSFGPLDRLDDVLPLYAELLRHLAGRGVRWVQFDEPALVADWPLPEKRIHAAVGRAYGRLTGESERPALFVTTPYGSPGTRLAALAGTGVDAVHLDLVRGAPPAAEDLALLRGRTLVAGLIDGRNVWKADLRAAASTLDALRTDRMALSVATSASLQHVPHDTGAEQALDPRLRSWLSFADQKVREVTVLAEHAPRIPGQWTVRSRRRRGSWPSGAPPRASTSPRSAPALPRSRRRTRSAAPTRSGAPPSRRRWACRCCRPRRSARSRRLRTCGPRGPVRRRGCSPPASTRRPCRTRSGG
jgi:5-methyltetrahydropteroyltriglutamate--homocysteine methyltransferase